MTGQHPNSRDQSVPRHKQEESERSQAGVRKEERKVTRVVNVVLETVWKLTVLAAVEAASVAPVGSLRDTLLPGLNRAPCGTHGWQCMWHRY